MTGQHKPQKPSPLVLDNSAMNDASDLKVDEERKEEGDVRQERACKGRKYKELVETGAVTPRRERKVWSLFRYSQFSQGCARYFIIYQHECHENQVKISPKYNISIFVKFTFNEKYTNVNEYVGSYVMLYLKK
jgi:hypothetical protein